MKINPKILQYAIDMAKSAENVTWQICLLVVKDMMLKIILDKLRKKREVISASEYLAYTQQWKQSTWTQLKMVSW